MVFGIFQRKKTGQTSDATREIERNIERTAESKERLVQAKKRGVARARGQGGGGVTLTQSFSAFGRGQTPFSQPTQPRPVRRRKRRRARRARAPQQTRFTPSFGRI